MLSLTMARPRPFDACIYIFIAFLTYPASCDGLLYKRWKHNTNLGNAENWAGGRLPCPNDVIHFPAAAPPVFIQTNISAMQIVLPLNGELVLGDHMTISFPVEEKKTASCPGKDVEFVRKSALDWFSPDSWCVADTPDGACVQPQPDLLDAERIPCNFDSVVFPRDSSFLVDLGSDETIKVSNLAIGDKSFSDKDFKSYLSSREGSLQFIRDEDGRPTRIHITDEKCRDISGCMCGNDAQKRLDRICEAAGQCPVRSCDQGIHVAGMCCPVCGAVITLEYGLGFKLMRISSIIKNRYIKNDVEASERVNFTVSKLIDDAIQVVFTDDGDGNLAVLVAEKFRQDMDQDIRSSMKYGVTHISMKQSGGLPVAPLKQKAEGAVSSGSVAAIVFSIIIIIVVIGFAIFCFADRSKCVRMASSLKHFRMSEEKNNDLELGPSIAFTDLGARGSFGGVRGFNNPMYDSPFKNGNKPPLPMDDSIPESELEYTATEADPATLPISTITVNTEDHVRGFDNPLYSPVETVFPSSLGVDSSIKFNPVYSTEGLEEDSAI